MSDDLASKLKAMVGALNKDDVPEELQGLLSMFKSELGKSEGKAEGGNESEDYESERYDSDGYESNSGEKRSGGIESLQNMLPLKGVFEKLNNNSDSRVNLLLAIKPYMSEKRQKKISSCIKLLQLGFVAKLLDG